ncbi:YPDG domain-containing protein [Corynebacterium camporealensis]
MPATYTDGNPAGTYTIDRISGEVTLEANAEFLGSVQPATIRTDGLSQELTAQYTPYFFPAKIELPSDNTRVATLGTPAVIDPAEGNENAWGTDEFTVNKETIQLLDANGDVSEEEDGSKLTVEGEGVWTVNRETGVFTFTPEQGFISDPTPLRYTAKNTDGVPSDIPGQIVAFYPDIYPQDAVTAGPMGIEQTSTEKDGRGDSGLTPQEMFPQISQVPTEWGMTYQLLNADNEPTDEVVVRGEGTYRIDDTGVVTFKPEAGFNGTTRGVRVAPIIDDEVVTAERNGQQVPVTARYTPTVGSFGAPEYDQIEVETGKTGESKVTLPEDGPRDDDGALIQPGFDIAEGWTAPAGWNVTIADDGTVTAVAPNDEEQMVAFEVPVVATYPGGEIRRTTAPFSPVTESFGSPEYDQVVVNTGGTETSEVTPPADAPTEGVTYAIDDDFDAPEGWTVTIDENTGAVTAEAPNNADQMVAFEVPVTATYPGNITRTTTAPFSPVRTAFDAPEYGQVSVNTGEEKTSTVTPPEGAPEGEVSYAITGDWEAPEGWTVDLNQENGTVTVQAPNDDEQMVAFEVPITATYSDGQTRNTKAAFSPVRANYGDPDYSQVVVDVDETQTSKVTAPEGAPEGDVEYVIDDDFTAPDGWEVRINKSTGEITVTSPEDAEKMVAFEVPVTATYSDGQTRSTKAAFSPLTSAAAKRPLAFETQIRYVDDLEPGEQRTVQDGVLGEETLNEDGEWEVTTEPTTQIIEVSSQIVGSEEQFKWTQPVPFETEVRVNPELEPGETRVAEEGALGEDTYTVDINSTADGRIELGDPAVERTKQPVKQVIEVGPPEADSKVAESIVPIPFDTEIRWDPELRAGEMRVEQEGIDGAETIATTVTYEDGELVLNTTNERVEPQKRIVYVGAACPVCDPEDPEDPTPVEVTRPVAYETEIIRDSSLPPGEYVVETPGQMGEETLNEDGEWVVTTPPVNQVIRVSTQVPPVDPDDPEEPVEPTEDSYTYTEEVPFEVIVRENPDLKPGESRVVQEGEPGEDTHTVVVTVDEDGNVTISDPTTQRTKEPVDQIIEVGPETPVTPDDPERPGGSSSSGLWWIPLIPVAGSIIHHAHGSSQLDLPDLPQRPGLPDLPDVPGASDRPDAPDAPDAPKPEQPDDAPDTPADDPQAQPEGKADAPEATPAQGKATGQAPTAQSPQAQTDRPATSTGSGSAGLANTGANVGGIVIAALLAMVAGALLMLRKRREN